METIRELRNKYQTSQEQLQKTSDLNKQLNEIVDELKYQLDKIKDKYNRNLDDKSLKIESYEEKIKDLELDLSRSNSKMDEFNLQYNEMKANYNNQYKLVLKRFTQILKYFVLGLEINLYFMVQTELLQNTINQKDKQMNELKSNLEKCLVENKNLNEFLIKQKQEFDLEVDELSTKVNLKLFLCA